MKNQEQIDDLMMDLLLKLQDRELFTEMFETILEEKDDIRDLIRN